MANSKPTVEQRLADIEMTARHALITAREQSFIVIALTAALIALAKKTGTDLAEVADDVPSIVPPETLTEDAIRRAQAVLHGLAKSVPHTAR